MTRHSRRRLRGRGSRRTGSSILLVLALGLGILVVVAEPRILLPLAVVVGLFLGLFLVVRGWVRRRRRRQQLARLRGLGDLLVLTPTEFEWAVGALLVAEGYRDVVRIGGAGDLGVDLTARDSQGKLVVVQCKRYAPGTTVGSPAVQSFIGMATVHHQAQRGLFVTTSTLTTPARALARQHDIEVIDGQELTRRIAKAAAA